MNASTNHSNILNILIVEDDLSFALELEILVKKIGYAVVGRVDNSAEALELIYTENPDLILMDVDIKGKMTGIDIGQKITHLDIPILFLTSFGDEVHYQEAEKSKMIGYLVKPINKFSLKSAINLAVNNILSKYSPTTIVPSIENDIEEDFFIKDALFFKKKDLYFKVKLNEITYVKSDDKYSLTYTTKGEKFMARIPISQIEKSLPSKHFLRIHRSYIVAINKITSVNFFEGTLQIGTIELPISRAKQKGLQEMMKRLT